MKTNKENQREQRKRKKKREKKTKTENQQGKPLTAEKGKVREGKRKENTEI